MAEIIFSQRRQEEIGLPFLGPSQRAFGYLHKRQKNHETNKKLKRGEGMCT